MVFGDGIVDYCNHSGARWEKDILQKFRWSPLALDLHLALGPRIVVDADDEAADPG
jgi:hypothetical protein